MVLGSSPGAVTSPSDFAPASSKEFLDIQATIECGFTLKRVRDMTRTYSLLFTNLLIFSYIYILNIHIFIYFYIYMYMYIVCYMILKQEFAYTNEMNEFHDRITSNSKGNYQI